jgi:hypothetical protein
MRTSSRSSAARRPQKLAPIEGAALYFPRILAADPSRADVSPSRQSVLCR